jgi:two-component system, LytTR family, sensor kinase
LAELLRSTLASVFPNHGVFALQTDWNDGPWVLVAVYATTLFAVALPIKIWDSNLNEKRLEQQQLRLNEARLAALSSQINPHFLFNTLNSVASLIRLNPEQARQVVYKLSKILRRLLRQQDNLITLREELGFIEDYLSIEMVRFDKLRFVKEVDPDTLDLLVPSMLLQPLVENSIRHGLASKVEGGTIRVHSRRQGTHLQILVEDDGVGIPESRLARMFEQGGIGVTNVNERLKVLYGDGYRMWIDSRPGEGTSTGIEIPEQVSGTVVGVESLVGSG